MRAAPGAAIRCERIARHGVIDRPASTVAAAARMTGALQAQDPQASRLGVRARATGVTNADVLRAVEVDRTVVRTWLMRATIHLVAAEDAGWMTRLLGPAITRTFSKRWLDLGLTREVLERAVAMLPEVLSDGPRTRREVVAALADRGIVVDAATQAPTHLMLHATTLGLICRGPERGRDATFALLDDWVAGSSAGPTGDDALAELTRRYFRAFSPATAADFTTWSGLASARAVALIRDELTPADIGGRAGFRLGEVEPCRGLRLLPAFDNYLVGYRDRSLIIDEARRANVYAGGVIRPAVLLDGRVIGTWRLERTPTAATVEVTPFDAMTRAVRTAVEAEIEDVGRFLALPTAITFPSPPR